MRSLSGFKRHWALLASATLLLAGCGGHKSTTTNSAATSIAVTPASISLEPGQVGQISAQAVNSAGSAVVVKSITYASSNTAIADVAVNGAVCAGKWDSDATPVVCSPATSI